MRTILEKSGVNSEREKQAWTQHGKAEGNYAKLFLNVKN